MELLEYCTQSLRHGKTEEPVVIWTSALCKKACQKMELQKTYLLTTFFVQNWEYYGLTRFSKIEKIVLFF